MNKHNMRWTLLFGVALSFSCLAAAAEPIDKAYVALEGEGAIAVIDTGTGEVIRRIDLKQSGGDKPVVFAPHNVQVAPNGKSVWITANVHGHHEHGEADQAGASTALDQVIVVDPETDTIAQRIDVAPMAHLSHVVVSSDGRTAYVNAQNQHRVYRIDTETFHIQGFTGVAHQGPHGLRLAPDGRKAYLAMLQGESLGIMDTASWGMAYVPVGGAAVQTAVTPDGANVIASIYDTKRLAIWQIATKTLVYAELPPDAKGPVQLYPTPDSRYVYVADQGFYFDQPVGNKVYKIDLLNRQVAKTIAVGQAPHGVVVSKDGRLAYITNLLSDDVSVIDTVTDRETARIPIGKEPNGISLWTSAFGGPP